MTGSLIFGRPYRKLKVSSSSNLYKEGEYNGKQEKVF
jgi:hypothetical protein